MEEKTIKVYKYEELSDEAKSKALDDYNDDNDYDFLSDILNEDLIQLLEEAKIENENNDAKLFYSLGYCQGDGVCFEGNFKHKGINFNVKHDGHYYHSNSVDIEAEQIDDSDDDLKNDVKEAVIEEAEAEFTEAYKEICDKIEKSGYEEIEHQRSEEAFKDYCEANERTFLENGKPDYF